MRYEDILRALAPCGLDCRKCMAHQDGDIHRTSQELQRLLGSFDNYAQRFSAFLPAFKDYPAFKCLLTHFTQGNCRGCRAGDCKLPNCKVLACCQAKGIDFCGQCDEFPCEKVSFDADLKRRWIQMNTRIKEVGVETYYEETKDLPRYV